MACTIVTTEEFDEWLAGLADVKAKGVVAERLVRMASGNLGDVKPVGGGVSEARVDVGPGYRFYFTIRQRVLLIALWGGDKGSQKRDIQKAKKMAEHI